MGDGRHGDREEKWDPVTAALESFFADSRSQGLEASLTLFPPDINKGTAPAVSVDMDEACEATSYETPVVVMSELPSGDFAAALAAVTPPNEWGTPTAPALVGTTSQAATLLETDPEARVAIVLVTDGEPAQCSANNQLADAVNAAAAVADEVPLYVIGVGSSLDNLNRIAEAGGTGEAFMVAIDDPQQTRDALLDHIEAIRGQTLSCELEVPPPPEGSSFAKDRVRVTYTSALGDPEEVPYSAHCAGAQGWQYDDIEDPKHIQLCAETCSAVTTNGSGSIDVQFTCEAVIELY